MPFEPEVFAKDSRPMRLSASRSISATSQHSAMPAGGPGSRSKAMTVGRSTSGTFESDGFAAYPLRRVRGALLLVEVAALDAVRVALERERAIAQVRQEHRCDAR